MFDIPDKVDGSTTLPASSFNSLKNELINIIDVFLAIGGDDFQIARSVTTHVALADFYNDQGVADAYSLVRPILKVQLPPSFERGMRVRFFANATNSGSAGGAQVDITSIPDTPKAIKKFDGSVLGANAIVAGEMTELVYLDDFFVVASSSDTRMITQDVTLTVAAFGAQFTTLHDAYESLRAQYILDNVAVIIDIQGKITETENTIISHSEGKNIRIVGALGTTVNIDGVNSVAGGASNFSIEYEMSASLTGAVIGDYVFINNTLAGGADAAKLYNKKQEGLWEITALTATTVTVLNKFGFAAADAPKTADLAAGLNSGKISFVPAQIIYSTDTTLQIKDTKLGGLEGLVIINKIAGTAPALHILTAAVNVHDETLDTFLGVVAEQRTAIVMEQNSLMVGAGIRAAISDVGENFIITHSTMTGLMTVLSNASGGLRNFATSAATINISELVVCGTETNVVSTTIDIQGGDIEIGFLIVIANKVTGFRLLGGRALVSATNISDNFVGMELWGGSSYSVQSDANTFEVRDNNRNMGRVGINVLNNSTLMIGVDESPGDFEINTIQITGHVADDVQVAIGSSAGFFAIFANSLIGKATSSQVASIVHNVTITTPVEDLGSFGKITLT